MWFDPFNPFQWPSGLSLPLQQIVLLAQRKFLLTYNFSKKIFFFQKTNQCCPTLYFSKNSIFNKSIISSKILGKLTRNSHHHYLSWGPRSMTCVQSKWPPGRIQGPRTFKDKCLLNNSRRTEERNRKRKSAPFFTSSCHRFCFNLFLKGIQTLYQKLNKCCISLCSNSKLPSTKEH